ncbi:MAG: FkbM family methyltransferase [Thiohalospira sp.]
MKNFIKYILQKTLGLKNYLFLFARFMIYKLPWDKKEKDFIRFLDLIIDEGDVLDIGANIGVMTYHFSKRFSNFTIHAFEPLTENLQVLQKVVNHYKLHNVRIYPFALGNKNSRVKMIMPEKKQVFFHGLSHVAENNDDINGKEYFVEMRKADDIKVLRNKKIVALKIDVEDYEHFVLKGAEKLIKTNRPLIYCELWESENRNQAIDFMNQLNYRAFICCNKMFENYSGQTGYQNFFFIPVERCERLKLC